MFHGIKLDKKQFDYLLLSLDEFHRIGRWKKNFFLSIIGNTKISTKYRIYIYIPLNSPRSNMFYIDYHRNFLNYDYNYDRNDKIIKVKELSRDLTAARNRGSSRQLALYYISCTFSKGEASAVDPTYSTCDAAHAAALLSNLPRRLPFSYRME